jgi:hypothetical protein
MSKIASDIAVEWFWRTDDTLATATSKVGCTFGVGASAAATATTAITDVVAVKFHHSRALGWPQCV